ncbi:MAG: threonylcarbamoyl-AMP synthase [Succinivibrio sp.]|nr:threonylcarbamoyl-AMP synthase [Succinivibrio sp.]
MSSNFTDDIEKVASVLKNGGVVITPSEGVYGISCALNSESAINRIISVKQRDIRKGLIVVDKDLSYLKDQIDMDSLSQKHQSLLEKYWPGPHTFVLKMKEGFHSVALRENHSLAVRISNFSVFQELCRYVGGPIISTSANISGNMATSDINQLDKVVVDRVDLVLSLPCQGQNIPTTIFDTTTDTLVRKGPDWRE